MSLIGTWRLLIATTDALAAHARDCPGNVESNPGKHESSPIPADFPEPSDNAVGQLVTSARYPIGPMPALCPPDSANM